MRCGRGGVTVVQPPPPRIRILGFISKQVKRSIILSEITKSLLGRNGGLGRNVCSYGFWDVSQNSQRRRGRDVLWAECCTAGIVIWTTCTWYTTMLAKRRWLGGAVVRTCDWRSRVQSQPLHSRVQLWTSCSHTLSSASGVTTLWRNINQNKKKFARVNCKNS